MGACASRFVVLKDGADPPPPVPMVPPPGDEATNRLSFDHLLVVEKNEGEKASSERESKTSESELIKNHDLVEGNCQENGSLKSLQPVDVPVSKTEVEKTEGLVCKTLEESKRDDARGDNQSEESVSILRDVEWKQVEINGKESNPLKTENATSQERI